MLQDLTFWDDLPAPNANDAMKICVCDAGYELGHEDLPSDSADVTGFNNPSAPDEEWSFDGM